MITLHDIRKVFNGGRPNEFVALDGINLAIDSHKATVIKGPSGSGKTTLLSLLGCMARPTSGRIFLKDREITTAPLASMSGESRCLLQSKCTEPASLR